MSPRIHETSPKSKGARVGKAPLFRGTSKVITRSEPRGSGTARDVHSVVDDDASCVTMSKEHSRKHNCWSRPQNVHRQKTPFADFRRSKRSICLQA